MSSGPVESSAGETLDARIARSQASAAPRATAHAEYSRSRPCFQAHSTWRPSLALRKRRNDSARSAKAEPVALRTGSSVRYTATAARAGTTRPNRIAPAGLETQPKKALPAEPNTRTSHTEKTTTKRPRAFV